MTFISYAQNYEDVMLYRALKSVERGFYVDVGAMDPIVDSVTKAFYERGWRGINIEPVPQWYEKLVLDRPEDTNLNVAILDRPGMVHLHEVADTGLSTLDGALAEKHKEESGYQTRDIPVTAVTLDMVLEQRVHQEIHFLKVDVEGAERQVLEGINLERTRPWIILVEATKPDTQEPDYDTWEHLITDRGYAFAYFDGLNRFYVAQERPELVPAFSTPPNVFDCFIKVSEHNLQTALNASEAERQRLQGTLEGVYASKSWRMTLPLRKAAGLARWSAGLPAGITRSAKKHAKATAKRVLVRMMAELVRHPSLKAKAASLINRYPDLKARLKNLVIASRGSLTVIVAEGPQDLSTQAQKIYADLLSAIEKNKTGN